MVQTEGLDFEGVQPAGLQLVVTAVDTRTADHLWTMSLVTSLQCCSLCVPGGSVQVDAQRFGGATWQITSGAAMVR